MPIRIDSLITDLVSPAIDTNSVATDSPASMDGGDPSAVTQAGDYSEVYASRNLLPPSLTALGLQLAASVSFGSTDKQHKTEYDVHGKTAREAINNSNDPAVNKHEDGKAGATKWGLKYKVSQYETKVVQKEDGSWEAVVKPKSLDVYSETTVDTPRWVERDQAAPEEQKAWDDAVAKLHEHEQGHVDLSREAAAKAEERLKGSSGRGTGATKEEAIANAKKQHLSQIDSVLTDTVTEYRAKQKQYDTDTDHGKKQ